MPGLVPFYQICLVLGETFSLFCPSYAPARLYRIFIWGLKPQALMMRRHWIFLNLLICKCVYFIANINRIVKH